MKYRWTVDDGYVGKSRPQTTSVPDKELAECTSDEEREQLIEGYIQQDFEQRISWSRLA
jgi:hypothetical protein